MLLAESLLQRNGKWESVTPNFKSFFYPLNNKNSNGFRWWFLKTQTSRGNVRVPSYKPRGNYQQKLSLPLSLQDSPTLCASATMKICNLIILPFLFLSTPSVEFCQCLFVATCCYNSSESWNICLCLFGGLTLLVPFMASHIVAPEEFIWQLGGKEREQREKGREYAVNDPDQLSKPGQLSTFSFNICCLLTKSMNWNYSFYGKSHKRTN